MRFVLRQITHYFMIFLVQPSHRNRIRPAARVVSHVLFASFLLSGASQASEAMSAVSKVQLRVGGKVLASSEPAYSDGAEVWAPFEILPAIGATGTLSKKGDTVLVSESTTGRELEIAVARIHGSPMIALSDLSNVVDGAVLRGPANTVCFAARIISTTIVGGRLHVVTSFPVRFSIVAFGEVGANSNAAACEVICDGAFIDKSLQPNTNSSVSLKQVKLDQVRVTLSKNNSYTLHGAEGSSGTVRDFIAEITAGPEPKNEIGVRGPDPKSGAGIGQETGATTSRVPSSGKGLNPNVADGRTVGSTHTSPTVTKANPKPVVPDQGKHGTPLTAPVSMGPRNQLDEQSVLAVDRVHFEYPEPGNVGSLLPFNAAGVAPAGVSHAVIIRDLLFKTDNVSQARIEVITAGKAAASVRYVSGTSRMELLIQNATIQLPDGDAGERTVNHPIVSRVALEPSGDVAKNVIVSIDTARVVGYTLASLGDRVVLELRIPRNATGALADKLIVIDPGHGGVATGASGKIGGESIYEKTVTLQIAMKLRAALEQFGARVVMTRDSDVDVPLYDRPRLANTIGADLFVSIHNDSSPRLNSASGTTTYFHASDPSSRALAVCIQEAVHEVSGLPGKGALSDSLLYASGLAVLRASTMPAVLCEVAYINNTSDRAHLVDPAFQQRVALAMCNGLRAYVEGSIKQSGSNQGVPSSGMPDIGAQGGGTLH